MRNVWLSACNTQHEPLQHAVDLVGLPHYSLQYASAYSAVCFTPLTVEQSASMEAYKSTGQASMQGWPDDGWQQSLPAHSHCHSACPSKRHTGRVQRHVAAAMSVSNSPSRPNGCAKPGDPCAKQALAQPMQTSCCALTCIWPSGPPRHSGLESQSGHSLAAHMGRLHILQQWALHGTSRLMCCLHSHGWTACRRAAPGT